MSQPLSGPPAESSPDRCRLLLVDDNAEGRRALARLLSFYDYDVTAVGDGASALDALNQVPPPDVVLTDLLLPDLDGREIARRAHALVPAPHVVMITGWDLDPNLPELQRWGIDQVFLKPVNVSQLVSALEVALRDRP